MLVVFGYLFYTCMNLNMGRHQGILKVGFPVHISGTLVTDMGNLRAASGNARRIRLSE